MRKIVALILSILLSLSLFSGCTQVSEDELSLPEEPGEEITEEEQAPTPIIAPLSVARSSPQIAAVGSVEPYGDYWFFQQNTVGADLSDALALAYSLNISNKTQFSSTPKGYDKNDLIEWGKDPGLNVDILHEYGFTGKGATIAYIDQPIGSHEQYANVNLHYTNNTSFENEMHGPMVLSLLAGKDTGTAPEAEVYYYGHAAWEADQTTHAQCLYQIIEQNKSLPEGEKITMVGFSDNIDSQEKNVDAFQEAVAACEASGVMVFFCGDYSGGAFLPMSNKNSPENVVSLGFGNGVVIPTSGRTGAGHSGYSDYYYWGRGGLSWAMPYVLGLYAIVTEIDPSLTKDELLSMLSETATEVNGIHVVNPVGFVSAALQRVGRTSEAEELVQAVAKRQRYLYAVMDTAALSEADLNAIGSYLSSFDGVQVLVVDTASIPNAETLYTLMKEDAAARNGTVVGVQLFGTPDYVPTFTVGYRVQMLSSLDEGGTFLTDLFYGNFENDAAQISSGYNVADHFKEGWKVDLIPQWPVARLPLQKDEFSDFFEKYVSFAQKTRLEQQRLVNFSNPIFRQSVHSDSFGRFLQRMAGEGLINVPYTLYGNLDGSYPVDTQVAGNFTAENLAAENAKGVMELVINSHGQWNNIDQCTFSGEEEQRKSLINIDTINTVLSDSPYYLDCWTCLNGFGMKNNLTTEALSGQCVGMFSATAIISNNGVNCDASLPDMAKSNFYYFYYNYLKALRNGLSRSQAFLNAQQAYGTALLNDSLNGLRGEGNYQFNLCNLLAYHNFGVLEPSVDMMVLSESRSAILQARQSIPKVSVQSGNGGNSNMQVIEMTDGVPKEEAITLSFETENRGNVDWEITGYTAQKLDNGRFRFVVTHTAGKSMPFTAFDPPNGEKFMYGGTSDESTITYEMSEDEIPAYGTITLNIDHAAFFVFFKTDQLR